MDIYVEILCVVYELNDAYLSDHEGRLRVCVVPIHTHYLRWSPAIHQSLVKPCMHV
jgi:hypothetical protein